MVRCAWPALFGAVVAASLGGCGKGPPPLVEAEGVVRLQGTPLRKVLVRFVPLTDYGPEYIATGVTDEAGRFRLTCKGRPGACAGENRVLVTEADLPNELKGEKAQVQLAHYFRALGGRPLPEKYGDLTQSPLVAHVKAEQKEYPFDLAR
jgi:hypothetical protein